MLYCDEKEVIELLNKSKLNFICWSKNEIILILFLERGENLVDYYPFFGCIDELI